MPSAAVSPARAPASVPKRPFAVASFKCDFTELILAINSSKRTLAELVVLEDPIAKDSVGFPLVSCGVVPVRIIWCPAYKSLMTLDDRVTVTPSMVISASLAERFSSTAALSFSSVGVIVIAAPLTEVAAVMDALLPVAVLIAAAIFAARWSFVSPFTEATVIESVRVPLLFCPVVVMSKV